ncbi:NAD(P)H-quinone oxidoreductase subunit L, chloroplastic [Actinidia eriantha]|uniref:NAD(P)H-quinone oxidoreductase subunit L, chloroplastic n=1 Tax=Actinidia eriantha TaxID=165200 RepID=UPI002590981E|nr:NAD(P)H-quinone oxidoreductase subunit L, chloroplastic [Actinidia eriantha]
MSFQIPSLSHSHSTIPSLSIQSQPKQSPNPKPNKGPTAITGKFIDFFNPKKSCLAIQVGAILGTVVEPAYAVTGVNNEEDFAWVLIQLGISAFIYFLVMPPIIMNWLRIRWYRRNLLEMYVQFMLVFMFMPGVMLWAPFLNFRKFPRDPSMEYPWSTPKDPSKIPNAYLKYPWATPEDYD